MIFLADRLRRRTDAVWQPLVLMGSEIPFPFSETALPNRGRGYSGQQRLLVCRCWMGGELPAGWLHGRTSPGALMGSLLSWRMSGCGR